MTKSARVVIVAGVACAVFGAGISFGRATIPSEEAVQKIDLAEVNSPYHFINPLLFCQDQNLDTRSVNDMEKMVDDYIDQEKRSSTLIDASFYFRDLNGGPWALVNSDFRSLPSSLLKVPVAISAYEHAEKHPEFLNTNITYVTDSDTDLGEYFQPTEKLVVGATYSAKELIERMLRNSDNEALFLVGKEIDPQELTNSYARLGIELPTSNDRSGYTMSVRTYSSFFRVLYNGTYLSRENSEHLLASLSQTSFQQGLVAKLPRDLVVSHKFGEASLPDGTKQLHDCGIVYKPSQPYLICVMTKGRDFDALTKVISHISEMVYQMLHA